VQTYIHTLKKQKALEESTSAPTMVGGEKAQRRTLRDDGTPGAHTKTPSVVVPPVVTNDFEQKLALISMV